MDDRFAQERLWAENELDDRLKDREAQKQAAAGLLRALTAVPADLRAAEAVLESGALGRDEAAAVAFTYTDFCFNAYHCQYLGGVSDQRRTELMLDSDPSPDPGFPGADMKEAFALLLRYGLDPNAVSRRETLIGAVVNCCNGYAAADTLRLLLDHGADPLLKPEDDESPYADLEFDIIFGSVNQSKRRYYDSWVHCWLVLIAHLNNEFDGREIVTVCGKQRCDCPLPDFKVGDLREHENYGWCLTNVPGNGENWSLHIFDRRSGWEVARL